MLRLVLRGFAQRKLRVALTAVAIVLGVALMAGTYILTDTINNSFAKIFQTASKGHDVVVTPAQILGRRVRAEVSPVTQGMLETARRTPGVAEAAGAIFTPGTILDTHRKRVTSPNAPAFIGSVQPPRFESFKPVKGSFPANAAQVAVDEATAKRGNLHIGEQLIVAGTSATGRYTIVGILRFGGGASFGGAGAALLIPSEAQRLLGEIGRYDQINVAAKPGVTPGQLRDRIRAELPSVVDVRTGAEQAKKDTSDLESNLGFLRTFLLIFAYVALFVGAFIIFNTFSITVAQRTREFGLLRTLGGSRAQILQSVVYEGLLLGLIGGALGLLAGIGMAPALNELFKAFGAELPDAGTVLQARTVIVSLLAGVLVTLLAGLPPALRATRVPPIAAMREGVQIPPRPLPTRRRLILTYVGYLVVVAVLVRRGRDRRRRGPVRDPRDPRRAALPAPAPGRRAPGEALPRGAGARARARVARALARHHRAPGGGELDPPAGAHARHRSVADRRPRAGGLRRRARLRLQGHDRPRGRPVVRRQPDRGELAVGQRRRYPAGRRGRGAQGARRRQRDGRGVHRRASEGPVEQPDGHGDRTGIVRQGLPDRMEARLRRDALPSWTKAARSSPKNSPNSTT